jgi:hypothetical protein
MLARVGLKFVMTFLLTLVLVLSGVTRSTMVDDLEFIANGASASLALPGETLETTTMMETS